MHQCNVSVVSLKTICIGNFFSIVIIKNARICAKGGATTFSITTLGINGLFVTLSVNAIQHNNTLYKVAYAVCRYLFTSLLNAIMLSPTFSQTQGKEIQSCYWHFWGCQHCNFLLVWTSLKTAGFWSCWCPPHIL